MTLSTEVTSRYPAVRLRQLTNPGNPAGTGFINGTTLGLAADDVEADFVIYAGVAYDGSVARHVSVAVEGVIAKLEVRTENPGSKATGDHDRWIDRLKSLAMVEGQDRVKPTTLSTLTREAEPSEERVDFDRRDFDGIVGEPPPE